jgi:hypothetical protein
MVLEMEVLPMRCVFEDGLRVSYCGPLRINKENEVDVFLEPEEIPPSMWGELIDATIHENCSELKHVAEEVTDMFGTNLPEY